MGKCGTFTVDIGEGSEDAKMKGKVYLLYTCILNTQNTRIFTTGRPA